MSGTAKWTVSPLVKRSSNAWVATAVATDGRSMAFDVQWHVLASSTEEIQVSTLIKGETRIVLRVGFRWRGAEVVTRVTHASDPERNTPAANARRRIATRLADEAMVILQAERELSDG